MEKGRMMFMQLGTEQAMASKKLQFSIKISHSKRDNCFALFPLFFKNVKYLQFH